MKVARFVTAFPSLLAGALALGVAVAAPAVMLAQSGHGPSAMHDHGGDQKNQVNALIKVVRESTERYKAVSVAEADGYQLQFGCVSGPDSGAMGLHFVKGELVGDGEVDATRPEIVIYEPLPNGKLRLIGADYLVLASQWDATHSGPPQLGGQLFHLFEAPNRFGLPAFYTLHVWAWKESPTGAFVNWHQNVSCEAFSGRR